MFLHLLPGCIHFPARLQRQRQYKPNNLKHLFFISNSDIYCQLHLIQQELIKAGSTERRIVAFLPHQWVSCWLTSSANRFCTRIQTTTESYLPSSCRSHTYSCSLSLAVDAGWCVKGIFLLPDIKKSKRLSRLYTSTSRKLDLTNLQMASCY